jgi:hypothetical protein
MTQPSVAARELALELHTLCRDSLEAGMPAEDVAIALVRVLAHITVGHDLHGAAVQMRFAETLAVTRARKTKVEAGQ